MAEKLQDMLCRLTAAQGPSGFEDGAANLARELLAPYMDELKTDVLGNVIGARKCGKQDAKKLLFDAHIDETGLIITGVEEGFLRFAALGGPDPRVLPAAQVSVLTDPPRFGVICALPPHVTKNEDTGKAIKIEDLFIDIGMSHEEAEAAVPPGTPAVFSGAGQLTEGGVIFGKALDDRAGFAAILRSLELLKDAELDVDLYVMASVQEEVGSRGAGAGAYSVSPDYAVVVDVGFAKTPDTKSYEVNEALGEGVIISIGPNMNRRFTDLLTQLAREKEIKHQIDVEPGGNSGTNARVIQIMRGGAATALIGMPVRYMHTPHEAAALEDIEETARLLSEIAKNAGRCSGNA